jgi:hypothetical protein
MAVQRGLRSCLGSLFLVRPWNRRTVGPRNINPVLARHGDAVYAQSLGNRIVWFLLRRLCHYGRYHSGGFYSASQVLNIVPNLVDVYVTGTVEVPRTSSRHLVRRGLELG